MSLRAIQPQASKAALTLASNIVCTYDVARLPAPILQKGGVECHPLTFRRDCLRHNEHHVPSERFLEELSAGSG